MPIGIIVNGIVIIIGGVLGTLIGNRVSESFKEKLNMVFAACAMCMGVSSIVQVDSMPAVTLATILGTLIGFALHLGEGINKAGLLMQKGISRFVPAPKGLTEEEFGAQLVTVIVLFCASGTGIYGAIISGITGDQSILLAKSMLDLPTALIFACSLGAVICFIAVPQLVIFLLLFLLAGVIYPLTTPAMICDFKACGGLIVLVAGFRIVKLKMFPTADMIPAMILVMPISWLWANYVMPLLG